jgi:hypothetical protein
MILVAALPQQDILRLLSAQSHPAIYAQASNFSVVDSEAILSISHESSFWKRELHFQQLTQAARNASLYEIGWDGYDAPKPNDDSINQGIALLNKIKEVGLSPSSVLPSADGGVGISFRGLGGRRALLEILNDGSASYVIYGKGHPRLAGELNLTDPNLTLVFNRLSENL